MHPDHRTRLRAVSAMFTGVVLMTTAMVGASAVATLVAAEDWAQRGVARRTLRACWARLLERLA